MPHVCGRRRVLAIRVFFNAAAHQNGDGFNRCAAGDQEPLRWFHWLGKPPQHTRGIHTHAHCLQVYWVNTQTRHPYACTQPTSVLRSCVVHGRFGFRFYMKSKGRDMLYIFRAMIFRFFFLETARLANTAVTSITKVSEKYRSEPFSRSF